jgi:hypothetical protein
MNTAHHLPIFHTIVHFLSPENKLTANKKQEEFSLMSAGGRETPSASILVYTFFFSLL